MVMAQHLPTPLLLLALSHLLVEAVVAMVTPPMLGLVGPVAAGAMVGVVPQVTRRPSLHLKETVAAVQQVLAGHITAHQVVVALVLLVLVTEVTVIQVVLAATVALVLLAVMP